MKKQTSYSKTSMVLRNSRKKLTHHGWNIQDADENTGYDHISEHTCLYDFGGVEPLSADEDGYYKEYREVRKEFEMPGTQGELDRFS